jgi:DNA-directed RNA polymerase subunit D
MYHHGARFEHAHPVPRMRTGHASMMLLVPGVTPHNHTDLGNALRRIIISDVSTTSVEAVTFDCNESIMSDKQLAHRIGSLVFTRGDTSAFHIDVQASDASTLLVKSDSLRTDGGCLPVTAGVPLVLLGPGARLRATATMKTGTGREHARFSPVEVVQFDASSGTHVELTIEPTGAVCADEIRADAFAVLIEKLTTCIERVRSGAVGEKSTASV